MGDGSISDEQISASSENNAELAATQGRLNSSKSWTSLHPDVNQWLQVDLGWTRSTVTSVATQGRSDQDQWVTEYKLQYSNDGMNFRYYIEQGQATEKVNYYSLSST